MSPTPKSEYFNGNGRKVWARMVRQYGPEKGKKVFYATSRKRRVRRKAH